MDHCDIFKYTLLNRVIRDLRPIIREYIRTYPLFVIGKHDTLYPDYRIITENDIKCQSLMKAFVQYYRNNNGLPSIDSFSGSILCGDGFPLFLHIIGCFIRCTDTINFNENVTKYIEIGNIISFRLTSRSYEDFKNKYIEQIRVGEYVYNDKIIGIGLYVKSDIIFEQNIEK